jgi:2-methylisocitrate lyase-like PEP mutase family enzyme
MSAQTKALRDLIQGPEVAVIPECYSALTARIAEEAGFKAVYIGGHAMGGMYHAIPDHGLISVPEMSLLASFITRVVTVPLIVDVDQAGETSLNVRRTVQEFEHVGVAGIQIEDTRNPKHLYKGDSLVPIAEMCTRIEAAVSARTDPDFVLIARTDELFNHGSVEEAIRRGKAYADAGADVFMCLSLDADSIEAIGSEVPIPLLDINQPLSVAKDSKLRVSIFTGYSTSTAAATYQNLITTIKETGAYPDNIWDRRLPEDSYRTLVRDEEWLAEADHWGARGDAAS